MRDGWVETPIGDVAQVLSGFAFKSELFNKSEGIPLIRIRDLPKRDSTEALYSGSYEDRYVVKKGDFLIGMDGEFHCYEWNGPNALLNQRVCRIQDFKIGRVVPRYIYFAVNQYLDKIEQDTGYTTVKHISAKQVLGIAITLPPLPEQKRIVDLISSVDLYIEALQHQLECAKKSRNAALHELLTAGGDDWVETTLGEIANWGSGGTPKADNPDFYDGEIPWCVIGDLTESEVRDTEKRITKLGLTNSSAKVIDPGSVLLAMYGASIGRTGISAIPMATNQAIAFARCSPNLALPKYLLAYLQTQKTNFVEMGQGAAQPNISQTIIKSWPVALPPIPYQAHLVSIMDVFDATLFSLQSSIQSSKLLRSSLLSDLLSDQHEIPASYDKVIGAA